MIQRIRQAPRMENEHLNYWWQEHWNYAAALRHDIYQRAIKANLTGNQKHIRLALQKSKAD